MLSKKQETQYKVTLPPSLEQDLDALVAELRIDKGEIFRRALTLFKHAAEADKVELTKGNEKQRVLLK